ncbi:MAG: hypothetical protein ACP5VP_02055 [Candidatus Limnocylindrales bacterium]
MIDVKPHSPTGGAPAAAGPGGRSWAQWRQIISLLLLVALALFGVASVATSAKGLVPALVMGVLVVSAVVAIGLGRALR